MYVQIACLVLGYLSTALCTTTTFWSVWAISGPESASVLGPIWAWKGLWADCMQIETGQYYCEEQGSMFLADGYLNAIRAFMSFAMCLSGMACFLLLLGMECTRLLRDDPNSKRKIMFICAIFHLIAGILILVSVAWYSAMIVEDFFSFETQDNMIKYELGPTLYLGYVSCFVSLCTGVVTCCIPGPKPEGYDTYATKSTTVGYPPNTAYRAPARSEVKLTEYGKPVGNGTGCLMEYV